MVRKALFAAGVIGVTAALAGCSPTDSGANEVEIVGGFSGDQAAGFQAELDAWSEQSGVKATYTALEDFAAQILVRVNAGDAPDIAIYPQPGVLLSQTADLQPLGSLESLPLDDIRSTLVPGWDELAVAEDGELYGLPVGANVKSLVWYNPAAFAANGFDVPTTDAELTALTEQIAAGDAGYPWCMGIESGPATGWPATDWIEEYVLRIGGLENYNKWWKGELKWNDPIVDEAAAKFEELALTEGHVAGGGPAIASNNFGEATANGLFAEGKGAGQCFMMRQGSFITDFFPEDVQAELTAGDYSRVGVFQLPTPEGGTDAVLGGGDLAGAFNTDEDTVAVLSFILSEELGQNGFAETGFFLSPHATFDNGLYPTEIQQKVGEILTGAEVFGFDASDLMPGEVGSGSAWTELTTWISGGETRKQALDNIAASWPEN